MSTGSQSVPSRAQCLDTARAVISGYNAWTLEAIFAPRAASCIHEILPASQGLKPMDNESFKAYFSPIMHQFKNFSLKTVDETVDTEARKVVMHLTSTADTDLGPYANEYYVEMKLDEKAEKMVHMKEFTDSFTSIKFFSKLQQKMLKEEKGAAAAAAADGSAGPF